jgi:plasmid stabilization system protein ParE
MKLRFTLRATADLAEIIEYIRARNPAAADRVSAAVDRNLQTLARFPRIGRRQRVEGVRKFITSPFRYRIYYRLDEAADEIVILSVSHPARRSAHSDA